VCRIAGILSHQHPIPTVKTAVENMCTALQHGGPDDQGIWCDENAGLVLGHRRLSLLDLSSAGHQPMHYLDRYVISFNGEIYNFQQLRAELQQFGHQFNTQTDTEVILAAYEQWGTQSFARLEGMFAFALWDKQEQTLLLVRDRSGIKPLYYLYNASGISFASETRAFQYLPNVPKANNNWPVLMLAYGHLPEPNTTYKDVVSLPKGFFLSYRRGQTSLQNFGFYSFSDNGDSTSTATPKIAALLRDAVKSHLVADAPIGVFLSGGIDSGILFLLAAEQKKQGLNSLSLYFNEEKYSEKNYQDLLLQQVNCERNQYQLQGAEFLETLPQILNDMDLPSCDGINTWFVSKYAKEQGLKAVLSGIGADELLGGYPSFKRLKSAAMLQQLPNKALGSKLIRGRKLSRLSYLQMDGISGLYLFLRGQFAPADIAKQLDATEKEVWEVLQSAAVLPDIHQLHPQNQASWMETNLYMQNQLLRDADVMSMAHGIEIRVPFLDHAFQSYCMGLPAAVKFGGQLPKALLIEAFKKELPEPVWNRPKMGFSFPFTEWLASSDYVKGQMTAIGKKGNENYEQFLRGNLHWSQLLSLMITQQRINAN
jgi:asparagine synthase (glutamine-hydrolysing)